MVRKETFKLYNGVEIPKLGFGTWQAQDGEEAYWSCLWALQAGYYHIDTAYAYKNEKSCGKAIKDSKKDREKIFVTTKLPAYVKDYDGCKRHFYDSLINLGLDYIDLYLIHAPWPWEEIGKDCTNGNIEVWKAMIELYNEGKIRAIGVSNFSISDIEALVKATGVKPMVNQIRYFVGNRQDELTKYCQENDILVEAYSPLATGKLLENFDLLDISKKYDKSIAQICIRYCVQKNTLPLPKSVHKERIYQNKDIDFEISDEDMKRLDSIHDSSLDRPLRS